MPRGDGTGPRGQGPRTGRGLGGRGFGQGRGMGRGQGQGQGGGQGRMGGNRAGAGPSGNCICSSCGTKTPHQVASPCNQINCPKCGTPMVRE